MIHRVHSGLINCALFSVSLCPSHSLFCWILLNLLSLNEKTYECMFQSLPLLLNSNLPITQWGTYKHPVMVKQGFSDSAVRGFHGSLSRFPMWAIEPRVSLRSDAHSSLDSLHDLFMSWTRESRFISLNCLLLFTGFDLLKKKKKNEYIYSGFSVNCINLSRFTKDKYIYVPLFLYQNYQMFMNTFDFHWNF